MRENTLLKNAAIKRSLPTCRTLGPCNKTVDFIPPRISDRITLQLLESCIIFDSVGKGILYLREGGDISYSI